MTKPKFTPAPYNVKYIGLCHRASRDMSGEPYLHIYEFHVHVLSNIDMEDEEGVANANLIAAAPDLYDALASLEARFSISYYEPDATEEYKEMIESARKALAKARGEL